MADISETLHPFSCDVHADDMFFEFFFPHPLSQYEAMLFMSSGVGDAVSCDVRGFNSYRDHDHFKDFLGRTSGCYPQLLHVLLVV